MKTKILLPLIAIISILLSFSCNNFSSENSMSKKKEVVKTKQKNIQAFNFQERKELLIKINNITDPDEAWNIYSKNYMYDVGKKAFAKWEELMSVKIAKLTDPDEAWNIYSKNYIYDVGKKAFAKWEELTLARNAKTRDPNEALDIYLGNYPLYSVGTRRKY